MLTDSGAPVLLTQQPLLERLPSHSAAVVCLDRDGEALARNPTRRPSGGASAGNLAYVIYTSGSTGRPKGVMIEHRGLSNYLTWAIRAYDVAAGRGAPVHSSISFDLTITGLLAPLLVGAAGRLCSTRAWASRRWARRSRRESDYSLVKITPAHLQLLGAAGRPGRGGRAGREPSSSAASN